MYTLMAQMLSYRDSEDVVRELRGAVRTIQQVDPSYSRAELMQRAIQQYLRQLRRQYNRGQPFPLLDEPLRSGKRAKPK